MTNMPASLYGGRPVFDYITRAFFEIDFKSFQIPRFGEVGRLLRLAICAVNKEKFRVDLVMH